MPSKAKKQKTSKRIKKPRKLGLAKFIKTNNKPKRKPNHSDSEEDVARPIAKKQANKKDGPQPVSVKLDKKNLSLVDKCKLQMSSSLLRLMDESLYNSDTKNLTLDKEKFLAYHEAYASVCDKWPTKPIDYIVKFIKKRLLSKKPIQKWRFADIGCGREPLLKKKLPPKANVVSFDLVSTHEDITEANMEQLPIENDSITCAVYSLSLMAKNLGSVILEGKRIMKVGGSMLVVEVTSRFEGNEKRFTGKLEKLGLKQKSISALPPNGYFTFFHFTKLDSNLEYSASALNIQLKPCVYKAR